MKNRNIPFGYGYENGRITVHPTESAVLRRIFDSYRQGLTLLHIAERLNAEKAEYLPGVTGWNKARLMRILDDTRYLGTGRYPAIITAEAYEEIQRLKAEKNTQKETDRTADIFRLGSPVLCPACGCEMQRRHDSRWKIPQKWVCRNRECQTAIPMADVCLLQGVIDALNTVIGQPDKITAAVETGEPNGEISKLEAEIAHTLESRSFHKEELREKMLACVSLKYQGIGNAAYITNRLKADVEQSRPLSTFSAPLCTRLVKAVRLGTDGTVGLTLVNNQTIGKINY